MFRHNELERSSFQRGIVASIHLRLGKYHVPNDEEADNETVVVG